MTAPAGEPDPIRARSRAEPPAGNRLALVIGAVAVLAMGVAVVSKFAGTRPAHVPLGIAGFHMRASVEEAKKALPSLGPAPPLPGVVTQVNGYQPTYPRLSGKTLVFDEPATCTLEFAVESTLSRIDCDLDPSPNAEHHEATKARLAATLRQLYGAESIARPGYSEWQNGNARLSLYSSTPNEASRVIRLSNVAKEHEAALRELLLAARQRDLAEEKRALSERLREVQRLQKELDASHGE